jgi:hypothetical protein
MVRHRKLPLLKLVVRSGQDGLGAELRVIGKSRSVLWNLLKSCSSTKTHMRSATESSWRATKYPVQGAPSA